MDDLDPKVLLLAMAGDRRLRAKETVEVSEEQIKRLIIELMLDVPHGTLMAIAQLDRQEYIEFFPGAL